jgi:DNA-binding helix-hairpin-helix protein with protein kinase domain
MAIIFSSGERLRYWKDPIGVGGEGKVYRVANEGKTGIIAKIYKNIPDSEKQEKLKAMIKLSSPALLDSCAWPVDTLLDTSSGKICGFTMHEVIDSEPLHHFYSPSWRKQNQPNASWDNLLQLSSNLTAVFGGVHSLGIVVGDVNPNSVRVRKNGRVMLIDSDSFQLSHEGTLYRCRVGVPSFTAPELLSTNQPFDHIKRNISHDLFGLSLLLFHLLFMGRHPFAGVFSGAGETPIESHIKEFRYAYADDHKQRGLLPPPLSICPRLVAGSEVANLFEYNFTQIGAVKGRTSARSWHQAILRQRQRIARCNSNTNHVYDSSVGSCIWCALEQKGLAFFEANISQRGPTTSSESESKFKPADLLPTRAEEAAWRRITAASAQKYVMPSSTFTHIQPRYGLTEIERTAILRRSVFRLFICLSTVLTFLSGSISILPIVIVFLFIGFAYSPRAIRELIAKYKSELNTAEVDVKTAKSSWYLVVADGKQKQILSSAKSAWMKIDSLKTKFDKEFSSSLSSVRQQHKDSYLRSWLIADANISGIGPGRSSTLASYGIETAADISAARLYGINGFGPVLTSSLLAWKDVLLQQYRQPSEDQIAKREERSLLTSYMKNRRQASADFQHAMETFDEYSRETKRLLAQYERHITAGQQLAASIKADIGQLKKPASFFFKDKYPYLIL